MFAELAPGIFTVETNFVDGMNGIITGERGALAVDVGYYVETGTDTAAFIKARGFPADQVILTHGHTDHVLGGAAFAAAQVYASAGTPAEIERHLEKFARNKGVDYDELIAQALFPTITFTDELQIDLGSRVLRLFPTPGHSRDHVSVYVLPERILFAADTVVTGIVPAIGDGDSRVLEATLNQLLALDVETLVAGHGAPLYGSEAIRAWITWEISYLNGVRAAIQAALAEGAVVNRQTLAEIAPYDRWIGSRLPADRHQMPRRHIDTCAKIATELQSEGPIT